MDNSNNPNNPISVTQALNQIQSWLNASEYEKVIQGSQEILEIEPGNQRALSMMKQAEEKRHRAGSEANGPLPTQPAAPAPQASPTAKDPFANLELEDDSKIFPDDDEDYDEAKFEKRKLLLAILIPAVMVVVIGGGIIWYLGNRDREETIEEIVNEERGESAYLEENEDRVEVIVEIARILKNYKAENGVYPGVKQIESVLTDGGFKNVPSDPRQGDFDKAGKAFGYIYAVYDTAGGDNSAYIISALFEDSKGFGYAWSKGASTSAYDDYRDYKESNVTFIGESSDDSKKSSTDSSTDSSKEEESSGPKVKVRND